MITFIVKPAVNPVEDLYIIQYKLIKRDQEY